MVVDDLAWRRKKGRRTVQRRQGARRPGPAGAARAPALRLLGQLPEHRGSVVRQLPCRVERPPAPA
ncbi:MAG TPA: hypothetical protein VFK43_16215 [Acidimicrobiales bacterium]|nr:hypothetical protein [Acidimicrobiales bacterium]